MTSNNYLKRQAKTLAEDPPPGCTAGPVDGNLYEWACSITGWDGSPYAGGVFFLRISFSESIPFTPPKIVFTTKVYHPNINPEGGQVFMDILGSQWCSAITIYQLLLSVTSLLTSPNAEECAFQEAGDLYKQDRDKYDEKAAEWTRKYAW